MKKIAFLTLFVLTSVIGFTQTEAERTPEGKFGRQILIDNGITGECFSATQTPQGLIIGTRTKANDPLNYLYTADKQFQKINQLDEYIVLGYSPVKGDLLLGKKGNDPHHESMSKEVYTYNLTTKKFTFQFNVGWLYGKTKYSDGYDSVVVLTLDKNSGQGITKKIKLI